MPRLFDLLSENTDDETISSLRKIAGGKKPEVPPKNGQFREKGLLNISDILGRLDFVALDLETTGLDNKNDKIIEIGAIKFIGGRATEEYSTFINPKTPIPAAITTLTGIKDADVASAPAFETIAAKLIAFIADLPLCGHQVEFDINFLNEEYKRAALPKAFMKQIDTAVLARIVLPSLARYTLKHVAKTLGVPLDRAHRALDDARASGAIAIAMVPKLCELPLGVRSVMAHCAPPSLVRQVLQASLAHERYVLDLSAPVLPRPPKKLSTRASRGEFEPLDIEDIRETFFPGGDLSRTLSGYHERPSQTDMAACVAEALSQSTTLVAEAGTGTGKSLAYLVPAALFAVKNECRVLVSTHTRNLQDQLISKDLPVVKKLAGGDFRFSVLKGRANYLCQQRFRRLLAGELGDFSYRERMGMLPLVRWAQETETGDIEEQNQFNVKWFGRVWRMICAESHSCGGRSCAQYHNCYLQLARQRALGSHIVVINHALFFSELCAESSFLGPLGPIVFDEAHHLEACGHRHLRTEIDSNRLASFLEIAANLGKEIKKRESLAGISEPEYKGMIKRLRRQVKLFQEQCLAWANDATHATAEFQTEYTAEAFAQNAASLGFAGVLSDIQDILHRFSQAAESDCKGDAGRERLFVAEIVSLSEATSQLKADCRYLTMAATDDHVFWCEGNSAKGWIKLCGVTLDVGSVLASVWERNEAGRVFTSATLSVSGSMEYFMRKTGITGTPAEAASVRCEIFTSPFSASQAIRGGIRQAPALDSPLYPKYVADAVSALLGAFDKNILVLFTANAMLAAVYDLLKRQTSDGGYTILAQGFSGNRAAVLEEFKNTQRAVLLGADSFWEGIDVPGKACEIVMIPRLPFPVPTHPLTKALCRKVEREKGESFISFSVPEAIIRFRQGTGRLIRTRDDRGALIVLDNRIFTKGYGKHFVSSLGGAFSEFPTAADMVAALKSFFGTAEVPSAITYVPIEDV
jgi:predicted DnaQ family exonuclease/DinG family helicase